MSGSGVSTNRDSIRCYKCTEYDHFVKDFPTTKEEREMEQIQQMFNLDGGQTLLKHQLQTHMIALINKFFRGYNTNTRIFKLIKGKNDPITFLPLNANIGGKTKSLQLQERNFFNRRPG